MSAGPASIQKLTKVSRKGEKEDICITVCNVKMASMEICIEITVKVGGVRSKVQKRVSKWRRTIVERQVSQILVARLNDCGEEY